MSLTNYFYEPYFPFADFDRLFDEAFSARTNGNNGQQLQRHNTNTNEFRLIRPRMDVHEDEKANLVTATFELPGLKKEDVQIDAHNNQLTVSGESKVSSEHEENGYAVRERRFGKFARRLQLPQGVKPEEIKASMENGVLTVTFPRVGSEAAPQKITVS
ncbi:HSP20-like chaperone [Neolentinus lepideus HHB14362 ss-1]|uniref:HSP20-like chaperone n=1 Tax=Neolentinus lepideus HHB14362 ss-1 TaxID=1314782 RepID=A0A165MVI3_9AGAM|nr:HSP20-like chaperone [Neolentinus lepideus HHB14362 ss-1]